MSELQDPGIKNYKTIIIGRSAVGKSTLLLRYVDGQFNPQKPTIGIDYRFKKLWDSAGQERYRTIVYNYFTLSKAGVVVFDLTNQDSLTDAKNWMQQLVNHCGNEIPKLLLGNKSDLLTPIALQEQLQKIRHKIDQLKQQFNCQFFAVSAKTGQNINEAFQYLVKQIFDKNKMNTSQVKPQPIVGMKLQNMKKQDKNSPKQKKKCC